MLVDVVLLRDRGIKRSPEELLRAKPVRGTLQMSYAQGWYPGKRNPAVQAGLVSLDGYPRWAIDPLSDARVIRIDHRGMVIQGIEHHYRGRRIEASYRQAWWCRPIIGVTTPPRQGNPDPERETASSVGL